MDTIIFDTSNVDARNNRDLSKHYIQNALNVCRVFSAIRASGDRAPRFVFLTNGDSKRSASVIQWLYDNLYAKGLYKNAWFSWPDSFDGNKVKPLILGYDWEASPEMQKYFTIRFSWAFKDSVRPKTAPLAGTMQKSAPEVAEGRWEGARLALRRPGHRGAVGHKRHSQRRAASGTPRHGPGADGSQDRQVRRLG